MFCMIAYSQNESMQNFFQVPDVSEKLDTGNCNIIFTCADPESAFRGGPTFFVLIQIPLNRAIIGLPVKRNLKSVSLACR